MGGYYACDERLPAAVADAIRDHYTPPGPSDRCPSAPVGDRRGPGRQARHPGRLLRHRREADRLARPYRPAPRRAGRDPHHPREQAAPAACEQRFASSDDRRPARLLRRPPEGAAARAGQAARPGRRGVRAGRRDDLVRMVARVEALQRFLGTEDGANLLAGYKRAANILQAEEKKDSRSPAGRRCARCRTAGPAEEKAADRGLGRGRARGRSRRWQPRTSPAPWRRWRGCARRWTPSSTRCW